MKLDRKFHVIFWLATLISFAFLWEAAQVGLYADPALLNFSWARQGSARLLPEQVYDDGSATFITWPAGVTVPAILVKDETGTEGPVNFAVRGATTVVDGVPSQIILRWGDDFATLTNQGPVRPIGTTPGNASINAHSATALATIKD